MRRSMIESDVVECVIGLGPNLFYNSPMEACLLVTKNNKAEEQKGKVLFINAVKEVRQDKNIAFLEEQHIQKILYTYKAYEDVEGFSKVVDLEEIIQKEASLNVSLYLSNVERRTELKTLDEVVEEWEAASEKLKQSMEDLFSVLEAK